MRSAQARPGSFPRALDPNKFADAREAEILSLCDALKNSKEFGGDKYGVGGLPRHLRRRAKSHNPYKHTKRPNTAKNSAQIGDDNDDDQMITDKAPSLQTPITNRKMRRKPSSLQYAANISAKWNLNAIMPQNSNDISDATLPPSLRRLESHLWHAKRLSMHNYTTWGWTLPLGIAGRGRGSRNLKRKLDNGSAMHDLSYWCPIILNFPTKESLIHALGLVLDPQTMNTFNLEPSNDANNVDMNATCMDTDNDMMMNIPSSISTESTLYALNTYPYKAIGQAYILYIAPSNSNSNTKQQHGHCICIWVHASIAKESYTTLQAAISDPNTTTHTDNSNNNSTSLPSLSILDTRRIEICGRLADRVIARTLFSLSIADAATATTTNNTTTTTTTKAPTTASPALPLYVKDLQPGQSLFLSVPDPRCIKPVVVGSQKLSLVDYFSHSKTDATLPFSSGLITLTNPIENRVDMLRELEVAPPPLSEAAMSSARAVLRQQLVLQGEVRGVPENGSHADRTLVDIKNTIDNKTYAMRCPLLLVRSLKNAGGWSLILPPSWVMPFFLSFAFQGCMPLGQREWHWVHTLQGHSFFPHDYIDSAAYRVDAQRTQREFEEERKKIPKGKAAPFVSIPQWEELALSFYTKNTLTDGTHVDKAQQPLTAPPPPPPHHHYCVAANIYREGKALHDFRGDCFVKTLVHFTKRGTSMEYSAIYYITNALKIHVVGDDAGDDDNDNRNSTIPVKTRYIDKNDLSLNDIRCMGYITSPSPYGMPRNIPSIAMCSAVALNRLFVSLNENIKKEKTSLLTVNDNDKVVYAYLQNQNSSALFPIKLSFT